MKAISVEVARASKGLSSIVEQILGLPPFITIFLVLGASYVGYFIVGLQGVLMSVSLPSLDVSFVVFVCFWVGFICF